MGSKLCRKGLHSYDEGLRRCPECKRGAQRARRQKAIPGRNRAKVRAWYQANRAKRRTQVRAWQRANPEKRRTHVRAWCQANLEKVRASAQRARARKRNALFIPFTPADWDELRAAYGNTCAYCGVAPGNTTDHWLALNKGGAEALFNLVPACKSCNSAKNDRPGWIPRSAVCACSLPCIHLGIDVMREVLQAVGCATCEEAAAVA